MLDRIVASDKKKVQFYLEPGMIHAIRVRAANLGKTQSKYIADLVRADLLSTIPPEAIAQQRGQVRR